MLTATIYEIRDGDRIQIGRVWFDGRQVHGDGIAGRNVLKHDWWTPDGEPLTPDMGAAYVREIPRLVGGSFTYATLSDDSEPVRHSAVPGIFRDL